MQCEIKIGKEFSHGQRQSSRETATLAGELAFDGRDVAFNLLGSFEDFETRSGQLVAAMGSVEQADDKARLHGGEAARHGGWLTRWSDAATVRVPQRAPARKRRRSFQFVHLLLHGVYARFEISMQIQLSIVSCLSRPQPPCKDNTMEEFDIVVVGLGIRGPAAAYHCARRGRGPSVWMPMIWDRPMARDTRHLL